ncbi:MAG: glycosyltransferase [Planctomycetota bacterium]
MSATGFPRISVVVLSYNFERYIKECLESLARQTLPLHEIVVCDDASQDRSFEVIQAVAQYYRGLVRPFRHPHNIGMGRNVLFGIARTSGELLTLVDGDDRFSTRKFEAEWHAMQSTPGAQVAYSNVRTIDPEGNATGLWYDGNGPVPPSGDIFGAVFAKEIFPNNTSIFRAQLMTRAALEAVGSVDPEVDIFVDWDLKIRLAARYLVAYSGEPLVEYRIHDKGMHTWDAARRLVSMMRVYDKCVPLLSTRPPAEAEVIRRKVQRLLLRKRNEAGSLDLTTPPAQPRRP